ncbi:ATP-binding cassette sub-family G member 4 [Papilio xuthus]|uniref:ATP-binding cassette sub-family G member 4 n=1 Tax=Papilio xuthus TaxID=66420 RepID=A0A194PIL7_PAPXU|nr:ATP-binding cassette sub-family G member 4 [Papilio xuthus]
MSTYKNVSIPNEEQGIDEFLFQAGTSLKALNSIAKRPPVNVLFRDIEYNVSSFREKRQILRSISGEFRSGELTCILGPSGAGKSSLLHILTGYNQNGVKGLIQINGEDRDMRIFKKLSCYIMHDDILQPRLTTLEAMRIAAELKLGAEIKKANKKIIVTEILQTLGLWRQRHTMCERLSGGQAKRLAIALELVNNPPVIFLDEPTSGLDVVSVRQLLLLLRLLSHQGRTIICTIHQPSASLFNIFDNAYGAPSQLVPFLAEAQFICPQSHNPADFVIETLAAEITSRNQMSDLCQNGKISRWSKDMSVQLSTLEESGNNKCMEEVNKDKFLNLEYPTSFCTQFLILIKRLYLQSKLPMEIRIIRREYFNRWYGLKAYYAALTFSTIPPAIFFGMIFITMTYFMSGQLFEWHRFILFSIVGLLTGFCSEGLGLLIGTIFNSTNGAILGPSIISPLLVLCCYGMGFGRQIESGMRFLMSLSYLRYGLTGMTLPMYQNRTRMHCSEDICVYGDPTYVLQELGMEGDTYIIQILGLSVFVVLFRAIAFFTLRHRLANEYSNSII